MSIYFKYMHYIANMCVTNVWCLANETKIPHIFNIGQTFYFPNIILSVFYAIQCEQWAIARQMMLNVEC